MANSGIGRRQRNTARHRRHGDKLHAAELATEAGIDTIVMNGDAPQDLYKILEGRQIGTFFKARRNRE